MYLREPQNIQSHQSNKKENRKCKLEVVRECHLCSANITKVLNCDKFKQYRMLIVIGCLLVAREKHTLGSSTRGSVIGHICRRKESSASKMHPIISKQATP